MSGAIGRPLSRPEGPLKVTGRAAYAADTPVAGVLYAVLVPATIANGCIRRIDPPAAAAAPGVVAVLTHLNMPRLGEAPAPVVFGHGEVKKPGDWFAPIDQRVGDVEAGFAAAEVKVEQSYTMPSRHHNPMEPSATIASWEGDRLTVHDATQWSHGVRAAMSALFGVAPEQIRVICPFTGGGFGCKGWVWPHQVLAVAAARHVGRPVTLVLRRSDMYTGHGFQAANRQSVAIGAKRDGRITAIRHDSVAVTSMCGQYLDLITMASRVMYATPAFDTTIRLEHTNVGTPTAMRPPQEGPGMVALESAMDELAYALDMDPLALRLRNYAEVDPGDGRPYSSKELRQCYVEGAKRFGWDRRPQAPGSMRDGRLMIGWGMASAIMSTYRFESAARVRMRSDGQVLVETAAQEIGTGNYAVLTQVAAMRGAGVEELVADGKWSPGAPFDAAGQTGGRTMHSYGAIFVEVAVDPDLGLVRMRRCVGGYSAGRIINPKTARSQMTGGIIWGYGQAVLEESAMVPVNADIPDLDVFFAQEQDPHASLLGARGIGELGAVGVAPAILNAVYHATGKRVRDLPIRIDRLL